MKKIIVIIAVVVLGAAGAAIYVKLSGNGDDGAILVSGNVEATEVDVGFKLPGRIAGLDFDEGERVRKGDRLGAIESTELEARVEKARAGVYEARARLEELKAGSRPQEKRSARAEVSSAEAELARAKGDFDRAEMLYTNGAISAAMYDSFQTALRTATARLDAANEMLSLVEEGPRKEDVRAAEYRVRQAEAELRAVETTLDDAVVHSPIHGVVLERISEVGETTPAGMPVYTIGDLDRVWIKVYVREADLGRVRLGHLAEVSTDSYPDKVYAGRVTKIASEAEFTPKNVQTFEERVKLVFGVEVSVDNVDEELKPGMPADVRIILDE